MEQESFEITAGSAALISVPSGQEVRLLDIIWNSEGPDGPAPRFRFVAPAISRQGGRVGFAGAEADLQHLCQAFALEQLLLKGDAPPLILVSIADREVPFGTSDPEATQYFEAFTLQPSAGGTTCIREIF